MRAAFTAACFLTVLVLGIVLGGIITESKVATFLESECARLDREEERAETMTVRASIDPIWYEAADWDRRGMGRRAR